MPGIETDCLDRIAEAFSRIMDGRNAAPVALPKRFPDNALRRAVIQINRFITQYDDLHYWCSRMASGNIKTRAPMGKMAVLQALKSLQAHLLSLTWTTQQIAKGDFSGRVDFMGDFSEAFNAMTRQLEKLFLERQQAEQALAEQVKELASARVSMLNIMEDLDEARKEAESATRAKSEFLANMSHEIRTPMNAVLGMLHLVLQTGLNDRQADYLEKAHWSAKSLLGIINDILDFSKIEAGKLDMETIDFNLDEVLDNVVGLLAEKTAEKGLELLLDVSPGIPRELKGDPLRLGQVLTNLANNARKFTRQGSVTISVGMETEDENGVRLQFGVKDTGIGMSEEQRRRLFRPFSQADTSTTRQYGGTGLGLAICKELVGMMKGAIRVESEPGMGSEFTFTALFGRGEGKAKAMREGVAPLHPAGMTHAGATKPPGIPGAAVLLAEDNAINTQIAREMLMQAGIVPDHAPDGRRAVNMAQEKIYDLVLMDIQMPLLDGYAATREIRALEGYGQVPIIAMTAHAMDGDRAKSLEAGMNGHITKPIDPDDLYNALKKWIKTNIASPVEHPAGNRPEQRDDWDVPELAGVPGMDPALALKRLGGRKSLYFDLIRRFVKDFSGAVQELDTAFALKNWKEAGLIAHSAKGVSGNIGAILVEEAAAELEAALRSGRTDTAAGLAEVFQGRLEKTIHELEEAGFGNQTLDHGAGPLPEDIAGLPRDLVREFAQALEGGYIDRMEELAGQVAEIDPHIYEKLKTRLDSFEYDALLDLFNCSS